MSKQAAAYVQALHLADSNAERVFLLLAERTRTSSSYEEGLGHLYAQLYRNSDDRDAAPRIWITPPSYVVTTVDELAEAIATAIAPYQAVPPPAAVIKLWLKQ